MNEIFNWNDTWILIESNWLYLLVALALGAWTGFRTCEPIYKRNR